MAKKERVRSTSYRGGPASGIPAMGLPASGMPASGIPAFGPSVVSEHPWRAWSWGTTLSTHAAFTPYVIEPMAEGILAWLMEQAQRPNSPIAFVAAEHFAPTLDKWARAEARRMRFEQNISEYGEFEDDGSARPILEQLVQWDKRAGNYAEQLGLSPPSLAKIRTQLAEAHREEDAARVIVELQGKYAKRIRQISG